MMLVRVLQIHFIQPIWCGVVAETQQLAVVMQPA